MGGFFGVVSADDCTSDLFYGTDFHSDLGTYRGGLAVLETAEGPPRQDTFYEFRMKVSGRRKLEQIQESGAALVTAPCFNCLRQIEQLMDYHNGGAGVGTVFELFDRAVVL